MGKEPELSKLSGKVAVITGAASGIGLAATKLFAKEGASVLAIDVDAGALKTAVGELGWLNVTRVSVMKSELRHSGSIYTRLASVELLRE